MKHMQVNSLNVAFFDCFNNIRLTLEVCSMPYQLAVIGATLGNYSSNITVTSGNVGIGVSPSYKLDVDGSAYVRGAIVPSTGTGSKGIVFPSDPGGGLGDVAWIQYYARSGEACTLEIGTANDGDDHIYLNPGGCVGIGTNTPGHKLDVAGNVGANNFYGGGGNLTGLNASQLTSGTVSTDRLPNSPAAAGWYGNATNIPKFEIDSKGRIISASTVAISTTTFVGATDSASLPSHRWTTATNTGMFSTSSSMIGFSVGGNETLTIKNGLVGINNPSPNSNYVLDVAGNINCTGKFFVNGVEFKGGGGGSLTATYTAAGAPLYYKDPSNNIVYLFGSFTVGGQGATLFTLPDGYRPVATCICRASTTTASNIAEIRVYTTGDIKYEGRDSNITVYLTGITFPTNITNWINPFGSSSTNQPGFNTVQMYEDNTCIWLKGYISNTNSTVSFSNAAFYSLVNNLNYNPYSIAIGDGKLVYTKIATASSYITTFTHSGATNISLDGLYFLKANFNMIAVDGFVLNVARWEGYIYYHRDVNNIVRIVNNSRLLWTNLNNLPPMYNRIATLPENYRPLEDTYFNVLCGANYDITSNKGTILIKTTGDILYVEGVRQSTVDNAVAANNLFLSQILFPTSATSVSSVTADAITSAINITTADVLTVNTTTQRVGIMNKSPAYPLDVVGNTMIEGNFFVNSATSTANVLVVNNTSACIGINKQSPTYALDVVGDVNVTGKFRMNGAEFVGSGGGGSSTSQFKYVGKRTPTLSAYIDYYHPIYSFTLNSSLLASERYLLVIQTLIPPNSSYLNYFFGHICLGSLSDDQTYYNKPGFTKTATLDTSINDSEKTSLVFDFVTSSNIVYFDLGYVYGTSSASYDDPIINGHGFLFKYTPS